MSELHSPVKEYFTKIARGYDRANTMNSLGLHHYWNQKLVTLMGETLHLLDLCAGTGEIARRYCHTYPNTRATLVDFCPEMLRVASQKSSSFISLVADVTKIPLEDQQFSAATLAYGIRNIVDRKKALKEIHRLLTPSSKLGILELTRPLFLPLRFLHKLYTKTALPLVGRLFSHDAESYRYLAASIQHFISPEELACELEESGFTPLQITPLQGGVATIIIARRAP